MKKTKVKIGITWADPYNRNLGVAALSYSTTAIIVDILSEMELQYELVFVGSSKSIEDKILINDSQINITNSFRINFLDWKAPIKFLLYPSKFKLRKLVGLDFIIDIGEGDSFSDIYGNERFNRILNSKSFFTLLGKKQLLLPQTIGPFNDSGHEKKAFKVMKKLDYIFCRDKTSFDYTFAHLPQQNIFEMVDVAFFLPYTKKKLSHEKINVGINISGLLWNGGYTQSNQFNLKVDYQQLIKAVLSYFESIENVQIHLIPHVVPDDFPLEDDHKVAMEIKNTISPNAIVAPRFATPIEAKSYISGLDFFTGARMHACIAAFSATVPVFPMAYSRKFNGLFSETLDYSTGGDMLNQTDAIILADLKSAFENRNQLVDIITKRMNTIVKERGQLLRQKLSDFFLPNK
ncbi:polysaccharide pyruvyl transferase family protein [Mangrovibacterium diazotrophicum]|uniref:Polysaccharide pyruvyl transferase WcaK-like protein n=1 Tax=Mangrovibacterium diazotrophicum TaxID=1261403 RepID=A0A419W5M8_9BACT|nr:polysaccharide pyruvyl transferase family protein [Mangrovibacterium diazotrophicum]RKD90769.1 polysaccharide pyruvyl transferase WcaK-like protein [Mangrovibacterium diazotrophicum]